VGCPFLRHSTGDRRTHVRSTAPYEQLVVSHLVDGIFYDRATKSETTNTGWWYNLKVVIDGDTVTLKLGGTTKASYMFSSGVDGGEVGMLVRSVIGPAHHHADARIGGGWDLALPMAFPGVGWWQHS
jgi:hypothetical protein